MAAKSYAPFLGEQHEKKCWQKIDSLQSNRQKILRSCKNLLWLTNCEQFINAHSLSINLFMFWFKSSSSTKRCSASRFWFMWNSSICCRHYMSAALVSSTNCPNHSGGVFLLVFCFFFLFCPCLLDSTTQGVLSGTTCGQSCKSHFDVPISWLWHCGWVRFELLLKEVEVWPCLFPLPVVLLSSTIFLYVPRRFRNFFSSSVPFFVTLFVHYYRYFLPNGFPWLLGIFELIDFCSVGFQ